MGASQAQCLQKLWLLQLTLTLLSREGAKPSTDHQMSWELTVGSVTPLLHSEPSDREVGLCLRPAWAAPTSEGFREASKNRRGGHGKYIRIISVRTVTGWISGHLQLTAGCSFSQAAGSSFLSSSPLGLAQPISLKD